MSAIRFLDARDVRIVWFWDSRLGEMTDMTDVDNIGTCRNMEYLGSVRGGSLSSPLERAELSLCDILGLLSELLAGFLGIPGGGMSFSSLPTPSLAFLRKCPNRGRGSAGVQLEGHYTLERSA
ncbi:hypothetical protein FRC07_011097 [Ceratobasidium sp. 392]|nr:hypothetical protein FRC07_011097 [Ceratobasidium sp. 392]